MGNINAEYSRSAIQENPTSHNTFACNSHEHEGFHAKFNENELRPSLRLANRILFAELFLQQNERIPGKLQFEPE